MKKKLLLLNLALFSLALFCNLSCQKKNEPRKIFDGYPVNTNNETALPALAIQEMLELQKSLLQIMVPTLNKMSVSNSDYSPLVSANPGDPYAFSMTNPRFGTANVSVVFKDSNGGVIDPIRVFTTTNTIHSADISITATSNHFTINETVVMTLALVGVPTSEKRLTGTARSFDSASQPTDITTTFTHPGPICEITGFSLGQVSATGTSLGSPATMNLNFASEQVTNGTMVWENQSGQIHLNESNVGFVLTQNSKYILN